MWEICDHTLKHGEKKQVMLNTGICGYELPSTLICGKEEGKNVLITACIHGDEYPGVAAVIQKAREIEPRFLKGNLILIPCVNTGGFRNRTRIIPEDGFNLNSDYPGNPQGTPGERLADYFVKNIFPNVDFILDLHSGSPMEPLAPCLFFPGAEKVREASLKAAMALDIPYLIESSSVKGEYGYAARHFGVPGLLLERGYGGLCPKEWVQAYKKDISLLLAHLEMYTVQESDDRTKVAEVRQMQSVNICDKKIITESIYLEAEESGLWYPSVWEGCEIKEGQVLGHTEDFFGNKLHEYAARMDGTVFYYTGSLSVQKGSALVAYGR